jgi:hypothetical protein
MDSTSNKYAETKRRWLEANKERVKEYRHQRYLREKGMRPTRRKKPDARCVACAIYLISVHGSKWGRLYCDSCRASVRIQKRLNAMYQRRAYRKRTRVKPSKTTWTKKSSYVPKYTDAYKHLEALGV